jgi:hypothetical protein
MIICQDIEEHSLIIIKGEFESLFNEIFFIYNSFICIFICLLILSILAKCKIALINRIKSANKGISIELEIVQNT